MDVGVAEKDHLPVLFKTTVPRFPWEHNVHQPTHSANGRRLNQSLERMNVEMNYCGDLKARLRRTFYC